MSWWKKLFGGASKSTLIQAAKDRNHALAKDLIAAGVDIDAADGDGPTPLLIAAINGDTGLIELLVGAGANVNQSDKLSGLTPLHMAARTNHPEAVHMLLRLGAAINARDQLAGYTPLHCAALGGAVQAINALVAAGAELEARCAQQGRTPILVAASEARLDAIATLAGHGAEFDVADSKPVNIKGNEIQVSAYMLCMLAAEKQGILSSEVDATFNRIRDKRYSKKGASR